MIIRWKKAGLATALFLGTGWLPGAEKEIVAVRAAEIALDGEFQEAEWLMAVPARDFIQQEPRSGEPATEETRVKLLYDDENFYIGVECLDTEGGKGIIVSGVARDFDTRNGDIFEIVLDTLDDNRSGFLFGTNPRAAKFDSQISDDGRRFNRDWDGIWHVESKITERGWQLEIAIPFKTLRFRKQEKQSWGVNFLRRIRRKNEDTYWAPLPRPFRIGKVSLAGSLNGIQGVQQGRNLQVKPYLSAPILRRESDDWDFEPTVGLDVKYGLTSELTLDATANTDFSQVEADTQQINLTRFSLFFPEKREFFLENSGIFNFGGGVGSNGFRRRADLIPFFSRRIGISEGRAVPISAGVRISGRAGKQSIGFLSMQQDEFMDGEERLPSTNFTVLRMRRDFFSSSDVGAIFINRSQAVAGGGPNRTYGLDGNFNVKRYLNINTYALKTDTPALAGRDWAGNITASWEDNFWGLSAGHLYIGENFNPEVGFVPRTGIHKSEGQFEIKPRPGERVPWIREFRPAINMAYITNGEGELETRTVSARLSVMLHDGDWINFSRRYGFERLESSFDIRNNISIPDGDYNVVENALTVNTAESRTFSGRVRISSGGFWNGHRDSQSVSLRVRAGYKFSTSLSWSRNDVRLAGGDFETNLITSRFGYAFNTRMFLNALIQYNSDTREVSSNVRFHVIHKPLSDFFLVYNETRSSQGVIDRALIGKLAYLFAF